MVPSPTRDYTPLRSVPSLVGLATICSLMQNFPIPPREEGRIPTILFPVHMREIAGRFKARTDHFHEQAIRPLTPSTDELKKLDARVEELGEQLQDRVREGIRLGVEDNTEELGDQLQERVREGIRLGIEDSIENLGADVVTKTTRSAVETGLGVFEDGVSALFGVSSRKKRSDKNDDDSGA